MRISKLMLPAVTVAGVLALAGCGGGSGGGSGGPCDHGANDDGTCRPDPNIALKTTANTEISEAIAAAAALGSSPSAADVAAARTAYDEAVAAINALPSGERGAQRGRLAAANGQIALHEGVQVRGNAAYAERLISVLSNPSAPDATDPATSTRNPGSDFTETGVDDPLATTTISPAFGKAPTVVATTGEKYAPDSDNPAIPIDGWNGNAFARDGDDGATETLWVYDDREASTGKPFTEIYGTEGEGTPLTLNDAYLDSNLGKIAAAGFAQKGNKEHSSTERSFEGTFDGATGTYTCTGTCTSTRDDDGNLSELDGTWLFTAKSGATVSVPDADYLHFGGWLHEDRHEEPVSLHAYASGGTPFVTSGDDARTIMSAQGAATYKGGAVGMYAIDRLGGAASGGTWTAKSELTAKFGGDSDLGSISGKIHDFMSGGQKMNWEVTLNDSGDTPNLREGSATESNVIPTGTTWKIGGEAAQGGTGTWIGNFYGDGSGDYEGQPSGVAGTFDANYGSTGDDHTGRMSGAFGATQ